MSAAIPRGPIDQPNGYVLYRQQSDLAVKCEVLASTLCLSTLKTDLLSESENRLAYVRHRTEIGYGDCYGV
jgi:hypothetical protein